MNWTSNLFTFLTLTTIFVLFAALIVNYLMTNTDIISSRETKMHCWKSNKEEKLICRPYCDNGSFSLPNISHCRPWLGCKEIQDEVKIKYLLVEGTVKKVYLAEWHEQNVVLATLTLPYFEEDFQHNIQMLKALGTSSLIIQMLGYCNNTVITEYHSLGSALNVNLLLKQNLAKYNSASTRLNFCISYVKILHYLHNSPIGVRVMCDSNSLEKTLSQYLLRDDLQLVLNDLDALPQADHSQGLGVKCGHVQLTGTFVAPEQLWPYPDREFYEEQMPSYSEKIDIWKIPDVCNWFLGHEQNSDVIKFKLFKIHKECKDASPAQRPSSESVLMFYIHVWKEMFEK